MPLPSADDNRARLHHYWLLDHDSLMNDPRPGRWWWRRRRGWRWRRWLARQNRAGNETEDPGPDYRSGLSAMMVVMVAAGDMRRRRASVMAAAWGGAAVAAAWGWPGKRSCGKRSRDCEYC